MMSEIGKQRSDCVQNCNCNDEQTLVAQSSTQTPQQQADTWPRGMATAGEDVQEIVIRDLIGREGFQNA